MREENSANPHNATCWRRGGTIPQERASPAIDLNHSSGGNGLVRINSAAAPNTRTCSQITTTGAAIASDITSTAIMETILTTFARRLIAP